MSQNTIGAKDLDLDLSTEEEQPVFTWFLACVLFGKPIQQQIARRTWQAFMKHGLDSSRKINDSTWQRLVDVLGEGGHSNTNTKRAFCGDGLVVQKIVFSSEAYP